jgi:hypothetical protein
MKIPPGTPFFCPFSRDQATAIFRIFQEILTNVARHAQATKVWVHLGEEEDAIVLEVEDNGVGISPTQVAERRSLGLLGMRERAGAFGGVRSPGRKVKAPFRDSSDAARRNQSAAQIQSLNRPAHEALSNREYQVMLLIAAGKAAKEISDELSLSVKTVGTFHYLVRNCETWASSAKINAECDGG